jgi:SAM-dependent methyltransferase
MPECPIRRRHCVRDHVDVVATRIREGEGRIVQCRECALVMQDLDWSDAEVDRYYNEQYQITNSLAVGEVQTARHHYDDRMKTIGPLFDAIAAITTPSMRVLEVGCGAGELLSLLKPRVAKCVGVELNRPFVDFVNAELGIEAHAGELASLALTDQFDLIICIDSLDHMRDPIEQLARMRTLLAPGGTIWLAVPNLHEALNHCLPEPQQDGYRTFFWHRAHFFYFTPDTLTTMLEVAGFRVTGIDYYHQYGLRNFFNWYFRGEPQRGYVEATHGGFFAGTDPFEVQMNALCAEMQSRFLTILRTTGRGDTIWCRAVPSAPVRPDGDS